MRIVSVKIANARISISLSFLHEMAVGGSSARSAAMPPGSTASGTPATTLTPARRAFFTRRAEVRAAFTRLVRRSFSEGGFRSCRADLSATVPPRETRVRPFFRY